MLPKILLNSRVSGNKNYLRGNVLTGWKGHSKKFFCLVVWGFFCVFFFGVFFFFLTAWYKKKKKKQEKRQSEIVISIILVKLRGCVYACVCVRVRSRLGTSGRGSGPGAVGLAGWGAWSPYLEWSPALGTGRERLTPLLLLPA